MYQCQSPLLRCRHHAYTWRRLPDGTYSVDPTPPSSFLQPSPAFLARSLAHSQAAHEGGNGEARAPEGAVHQEHRGRDRARLVPGHRGATVSAKVREEKNVQVRYTLYRYFVYSNMYVQHDFCCVALSTGWRVLVGGGWQVLGAARGSLGACVFSNGLSRHGELVNLGAHQRRWSFFLFTLPHSRLKLYDKHLGDQRTHASHAALLNVNCPSCPVGLFLVSQSPFDVVHQ